MRTCLYCGAILDSQTARFCPGHHRPYRLNLINEWMLNRTNDAVRREIERKLQRFPGWWDYENEQPVATGHRRNSNNSDQRRNSTLTNTSLINDALPFPSPAPVEPVVEPVEYRFRKFGVEIETFIKNSATFDSILSLIRENGITIIDRNHYVHDGIRNWKTTSDASIHPEDGYSVSREFVSPVITSEHKAREVMTIVTILNTFGVKVNNSCGYHVHLDIHDLTPKQVARIYKFYQAYEAEIDKFHQASRRGNNAYYCGTLQSYTIPENPSSISEIARVVYDRHIKVNILAYTRQGTIEFRQHGGTIDPVKIMYWVKFCTRVVEFAKTNNPIDASVPLYTALNLSAAEKIYWNYRKQVLSA